MAFGPLLARLRNAKYAHLGDPALWNGKAVTVLDDRHEEIAGLHDSPILMPVVIFRVRKSEVPCPIIGDLVEFAGEIYTVIAEPRLEATNGEWVCEFAPPKSA